MEDTTAKVIGPVKGLTNHSGPGQSCPRVAEQAPTDGEEFSEDVGPVVPPSPPRRPSSPAHGDNGLRGVDGDLAEPSQSPAAAENIEGMTDASTTANPTGQEIPPVCQEGATTVPTAPGPTAAVEVRQPTGVDASEVIVITHIPVLSNAQASDPRVPSYPLRGTDTEVRGRDLVKYTLARAHSFERQMKGYKMMTDD